MPATPRWWAVAHRPCRPEKYWPRQRGFDYHFGAVLGEIDYFTHSAHGKTDWYRDNELVREDGYATDLLGDDAVRLIREYDGKKPMFLLAFTAPHSPFQAPEHYQRATRGSPMTRRAYAADHRAGRPGQARGRRAQEARHARGHVDRLPERQRRRVRSSKFAGGRRLQARAAGQQWPVPRRQRGTLYEGRHGSSRWPTGRATSSPAR